MQPLNLYLNGHLAASNAGIHAFRHAAKHISAHRTELLDLTSQIADDRRSLCNIMAVLGVKEIKPFTVLGGGVGWMLRMSPSGHIRRRTPLSDLLELEALRSAVSGKLAGWNALRCVAERGSALSVERIDDLIDRANAQIGGIHDIHQTVALSAFHPRGTG